MGNFGIRFLSRRHSLRAGVWLLAMSIGVVTACAQGLVIDHGPRIVPPRPPIPRPTPLPSSYKVRTLDVKASIRDQGAKVQVSQVFQNTGSIPLEAQFAFPVPENAAISGLTLLVDGKELPGKLLKKEDARRIYEETVRRQRDPALLEYLGQGLFQSSVFPIPPQAERTVEIRYTQLLKKDGGLVDFILPIGTTKHSNHPVESLNVTIRVETADEIKTIYSPTHPVEIQRSDDHHAIIRFALKDSFAPNDFRLLYGTVNGLVGMNVISYRPADNDDGYFVMLASPEVRSVPEQRIDKSMVFVFDKSGSMSGKKIEQARAALKFLISQLKPGDTFNIVAYDSAVETFRPELQRVDDATLQAALGFADGMYAGGSTNIDGALQTALRMLNDPGRPSYVLFMTDGLPTVGVLDERQIAARAGQSNTGHARLFVFGVGYDVNARLLDRLAHEQRGQSAYVRPNESIETQIASLSARIGSPVLTDLDIAIEFDKAIPPGSALPISRTYPRQLTDLFQGEQLVWVGRYRFGGAVKITLTGALAQERKTFTFPATLVDRSADESSGFVETLWATRRIGEIIDELDLKGHNQELIDELVQLSLRHGILTPYTSFLADEHVTVADRRHNRALGLARVERELAKTEGVSGVAQRAYKGQLQSAAQPAPLPAGGAGLGQNAARSPASRARLNEAMAKFQASGGRATVTQDASGEIEVLETVRIIGQKAFFRKNNQWHDSTVTPEQAAGAIRIVPFSDEYFDLAAKQGGALARYLAFQEPLLLNFKEKTYLIAAPENAPDRK
jgi:Ca-activated chloride channel family protein